MSPLEQGETRFGLVTDDASITFAVATMIAKLIRPRAASAFVQLISDHGDDPADVPEAWPLLRAALHEARAGSFGERAAKEAKEAILRIDPRDDAQWVRFIEVLPIVIWSVVHREGRRDIELMETQDGLHSVSATLTVAEERSLRHLLDEAGLRFDDVLFPLGRRARRARRAR